MEKTDFAIFYITHASKAEAESFVNDCIQEKWIACGNIFPIDSTFLWESKVVQEDEFVSIVKTGIHLISAFTTFAENLHPYETPCILHWEVRANENYTKWIYRNVRD